MPSVDWKTSKLCCNRVFLFQLFHLIYCVLMYLLVFVRVCVVYVCVYCYLYGEYKHHLYDEDAILLQGIEITALQF